MTAPPGPPLPASPLPPMGVPPAPARAVPARTMTFQKPADAPADSPAAPVSPQGMGKGQANPKDGLKGGEAGTGPAAQTPFEGAVNRSTAFRLMGDAELNRRMVGELVREANAQKRTANADSQKLNPADYKLPEVQPVAPAGTQYVPKTVNYPPAGIAVEPTYVTHRRLYFEDRNTERYGWDLGPLQTVVSAGAFYKDVFLFPAYFASHPRERYDTSAGKCRPGDPVPYYWYPPEIDIWGYSAQAATLVGAGFIFPY